MIEYNYVKEKIDKSDSSRQTEFYAKTKKSLN